MAISIKPDKITEKPLEFHETNEGQLGYILDELRETEQSLANSMGNFVSAIEGAMAEIKGLDLKDPDLTFLQSVIDVYKPAAVESKLFSEIFSSDNNLIDRVEKIKNLYPDQELMANYSNVMGMSLSFKDSFARRFNNLSEKNRAILAKHLHANLQEASGYEKGTSDKQKFMSELAKPGQRMPRHELFSKEINKRTIGFESVPVALKTRINLLNDAIKSSEELSNKIKNGHLISGFLDIFNREKKQLFLNSMAEVLASKMLQAKLSGQFDDWIKEIEFQKKSYLETFENGKEHGKVSKFLDNVMQEAVALKKQAIESKEAEELSKSKEFSETKESSSERKYFSESESKSEEKSLSLDEPKISEAVHHDFGKGGTGEGKPSIGTQKPFSAAEKEAELAKRKPGPWGKA